MHLVSDVDFAELFEKAEHGELQFLVPGLREPRICQVHQLQNAKTQRRGLGVIFSPLITTRDHVEITMKT